MTVHGYRDLFSICVDLRGDQYCRELYSGVYLFVTFLDTALIANI